MRPARKGPENRGVSERGAGAGRASMRPARKGPENRGTTQCDPPPAPGFNEAGPQGAGKPSAFLSLLVPVVCFNEAGPQGAGKPAMSPLTTYGKPPLQ